MRRFFCVSTCLFALVVLNACGAQTAEELLAEGGRLLQNRDTYGAEVKFQQVIEKHPGTQEAMIARQGLAEIYKQTNDPENAIRQYDLLMQEMGGPQSPDGFRVFFAKVQVPTLQSDYKRAIAMVLETSPTMKGLPADGQVMLLGNLMNLYLLDGQGEKATEILDAYERLAMGAQEAIPPILSVLGDLGQRPELTRSVVAFHKNLLEKYPDSLLKARILFDVFRFEQALGLKEEAQAHLQEAITAQQALVANAIGEEENSAALLQLGNLYQTGGELEKARAEYEKLVTQYPKSIATAMALHFLADLDVMASNYASAEQRLRQVEQQFPNTREAMTATQKLAMLANRSSTETLTAPVVGGAAAGPAGLDAPVVELTTATAIGATTRSATQP